MKLIVVSEGLTADAIRQMRIDLEQSVKQGKSAIIMQNVVNVFDLEVDGIETQVKGFVDNYELR